MRFTASVVIPCTLLIATSAALAAADVTSNVKPFELGDAVICEPPVVLGDCTDCPSG